ncbi:hypothetical protein [Nannocystis sp. SCPEA4]|uniref:hypothetical protein n=1 Tax=Nannocystis sp. SCPEA4 TaxID=2996787 RepID=UPI00226F73AE|nr:hypothetical protein [Nannocystis sp. SCPEA4]MCY1055680.1 hypothetical protein [Nannocystis sp. SCPEA4]
MPRLALAVLLVAACGPSTASSDSDATTGPDPTTMAATSGDSLTPTTSTTTESTTPTTSGTTASGPPSQCGPPCEHTWEYDWSLIPGSVESDFRCLTRVRGDLTIGLNTDPAIVATLANLTRVDGALQIWGADIPDLSTFACLREVGELELMDLPELADLSPLSQLRRAPSINLIRLGIAALPTFAPDFAGIERLDLSGNSSLTDISELAVWGLAGDTFALDLHRCPQFTDLGPLAALPLVDAARVDVSLFDLPALDSLAPLGAITSGTIELTTLPKLTSLSGLEALTSGSLRLVDLPALTDLVPLAGLREAETITIDDLPQLTSLTGLGALERVEHTFELGGCSAPALPGLHDLQGLDSLARVGSLNLLGLTGLTTLAGAPLLTELAHLDIVDSPALPQAAFDAFLAQLTAAPMACFGPEGDCICVSRPI